MTQKEYIGATLKIIGLAVIIYGGVALARNLIQGIYAHHQLSKPSTTYSDSLPADIKMDMDTRITFNSASNRLVAVFYLAHIPSNLARQPAASATLAAGWRGSAFVNACGEGKVPCLERGGKGKARAGAELRRGARL